MQPTDQEPSEGLDESLLMALSAAKTGAGNPLLDETVLGSAARPEAKDAPLVAVPGEMEILGSEEIIASAPKVSNPAREPEASDAAHTPHNSAPVETAKLPQREDFTGSSSSYEQGSPSERRRASLGGWMRARLTRLMVCGAVGTAAGVSLYQGLLAGQERQPLELLRRHASVKALGEALERAQALARRGAYDEIPEILGGVVATAPATPRRVEAQFLVVEAQVESSPDLAAVYGSIDAVLAAAPAHARAPEAELWKARLLERENKLAEASTLIERVLESHPESDVTEAAMLQIGRLLLKRREVEAAAEHGRQALAQFPESPRTAEAQLLLADALAASGKAEEAVGLYKQVAGSVPFPPAQGELGTMLPEALLAQARALRELGMLAEALSVLEQALETTPNHAEMLLALMHVLEHQGKRQEALRVARQAQSAASDDGEVQEQTGDLFALAGDYLAAAEAYRVAAQVEKNPKLMLDAARQFRAANKPERAQEVYAQLSKQYAGGDEAFTGEVESALALLDAGNLTAAQEHLNALAVSNAGTPREMEALLGLAQVYRKLGLPEQAADIARSIVRHAGETTPVADAMVALAEAGAVNEALLVAERLELGNVVATEANRILIQAGRALLAHSAPAGLEFLERAHREYPGERTAEHTEELVEAYLAAGRPEPAQALVEELRAQVESAPVNTAYLIDAAVAVGDYAYGAIQLETALAAYTLVEEVSRRGNGQPAAGRKLDVRWASYQRGNVLLALGQHEEAVELLRGVAESDVPWAREAEVAAATARLHLRKQQLPVGQVAKAGDSSTPAGRD